MATNLVPKETKLRDWNKPITKTCPCNIQRFFSPVKENIFSIFLIFAQNIDCGYTLEPPRRKVGIPLQTPVLLYKSGV